MPTGMKPPKPPWTPEADQTLVDASYYTDAECIDRVADWIAEGAV
jgi:hypothetical protein